MPLPETSAGDLACHLTALGVEPGMDVVVHSSLVAFGRLPRGVETVYAALRQVLGEAATIAVPTYTFRNEASVPFDPARTPSVGVGVFSEHLRQRPEARRSWCPLHSHAAEGPKATLLRQELETVSFGAGSDFEVFREAGFHLLTLGCPFLLGASYVHHIEAVVGVPYRRWVVLNRQIVLADGALAEGRCRYYERRARSIEECFAVVGEALEAKGRLRQARCALGNSTLCELAQVHAEAEAILRVDPGALVRLRQ